MAADGFQGFQGKAWLSMNETAVDFAYDWVADEIAVELLSYNVGMQTPIIPQQGMRGYISHPKERIYENIRDVSGSIAVNPSAAFLERIFWTILGNGGNLNLGVTTFTPNVALVPFGLMVRFDADANRIEHVNCYSESATFSGSAGELIAASIGVQAEDERTLSTGTQAAAIPNATLNTGANDAPMIFASTTLDIGGQAYETESFELTINNSISKRFANSLTPTSFLQLDRNVTLSLSPPMTTTPTAFASLFDAHRGAPTTTANVTLTMVANNTNKMVVKLPNCVYNFQTPGLSGRDEIYLPFQFTALSSDDGAGTVADEITVEVTSAA